MLKNDLLPELLTGRGSLHPRPVGQYCGRYIGAVGVGQHCGRYIGAVGVVEASCVIGVVASATVVKHTCRRVPCVTAVGPWQVRGERTEQVIQRPRDDDVVVDTHYARDQHHAPANTWKIEFNKYLLDMAMLHSCLIQFILAWKIVIK